MGLLWRIFLPRATAKRYENRLSANNSHGGQIGCSNLTAMALLLNLPRKLHLTKVLQKLGYNSLCEVVCHCQGFPLHVVKSPDIGRVISRQPHRCFLGG